MGLFSKLRGGDATKVTADEARERQRRGSLLIDVRGRDEWQAGHAPKARHHPLPELAGVVANLPHDRELLVICRSGNRSARAAKLLRRAGLDALDVAGGMRAWQQAGGAVVSTRGGRGRVV